MGAECEVSRDVEAYAHDLGRTVESLCSGDRYFERNFPELAARALRAVTVPSGVNANSVLRYATCIGNVLPPQSDPRATFGQPPVTLFHSEHFSITALYWLDGTTDIHQHSFGGAFRVLTGSSLHAPYRFSVQEAIGHGLLLGDLTMGSAEILRAGDVREIPSGEALIHSLFHLERPSVTIVVRTHSDPWAFPQLSYERPGLAHDRSFSAKMPLLRRLQSLGTLAELAPNEAFHAALELIASTSVAVGFEVVGYWARVVGTGTSIEGVIGAYRDRHGSIADVVAGALDERQRQRSIIVRRKMLRSPEHRLFLALLLNLPDLTSVLSILGQLFPGVEPGDKLAVWITELSSPENTGASGLSLRADELAELSAAFQQGTIKGDNLDWLSRQVRESDMLRKLLVTS